MFFLPYILHLYLEVRSNFTKVFFALQPIFKDLEAQFKERTQEFESTKKNIVGKNFNKFSFWNFPERRINNPLGFQVNLEVFLRFG